MKRAYATLCTASLLALGALTGCATDSKPGAPTAAFLCDDNTRFIARFEPNEAVVTIQGGETYRLPQKPAASGMWYAWEPYSLRGKGNDATWVTPAGSTECKVV